MKNKDFGFFQQHVEKIALGIGGLVLVGVGATQFLLGEPNAIEIDNQTVAPGQIEETVVRQSDLLKNKLDGGSPIEPIDVPRYAEFFTTLYGNPVATDQQLAAIDNTGLSPELNVIISPEYPPKFLPTPPIATDVLAKSGHGVLANDGSDRYFDFKEIVGDQQPADFRYVSVSAEFSFEELINRYRAIDVPGEQRIDEGLWRERLAITSVQLLREEQDPITGEWGSQTTISPLPRSFAIVPSNQPTLTFEESQDLEARIRASQPEILRVVFPQISNGPWTPPDIANRVYTAEELQRREELERKITSLTRNLDRLTGNDERETRDRRDDRGSRRGDDSGYEDFGDGPPESSRSNRRSNRDSGEDEADTRRADRTAQRIAGVEEELLAAKRELNELLGIEEDPDQPQRSDARSPYGSDRGQGGFGGPGDGLSPDFPDNPDFGGGYNPRRPAGRALAEGDVPDQVKVWAHDLTAKPGKTYRYKVLVSVMNPLYRFPRLSPEQLTENRNRISLGPSQEAIDAAEWSLSATVTLDPEHYFFVDSASKDQKRANIEVWTVYDGMWRKNEFVEYPGNEVGGIAEPQGLDTRGRGVAMNAGPIMLDVDSVAGDNGRAAVRVLFLDPETNRIMTRLVNEDKNSVDRKRLQLEADLQAKQAENRLSDSRR